MKIQSAMTAAVTVVLAGCMSMQPVKQPVEFLQRNNPEVLRLHQPGQELVVLRSPRLLSNGTVAGFDVIENANAEYSLSAFQVVEAKQIDKTRTAFLAAAGAALVGVAAWGIAHPGEGKSRFCERGDCVQAMVSARRGVNIPLSALLRR